MLIIAICVKAYDRGPVFYSLGQADTYKGKEFKILNSGVRVQVAKSRELVLQAKNHSHISPVGKVASQSSSLMKLPQLFNVFKGDMSLVGLTSRSSM